jgi:hypothetical protein
MHNLKPINFSRLSLKSLSGVLSFALAACAGSPTKEVTIGLTRSELDRFLQVNGYVKREELKDFLVWEHILAALRDPKSKLYQELMILGERDNARTIETVESAFKNPAASSSRAIKALIGFTDKELQDIKDILLLHTFIAQIKKLSDPSTAEARTLEEFLKELSSGKGRLLGLFGNALKGEDDAIGVANLNTATLDKLLMITAIIAKCPLFGQQQTAEDLLFDAARGRANLVGAVHGIEPINKNSAHEAFCKKEGVSPATGPTLNKIFVYNNMIYQCSATGPAGTAKVKQLKADASGFDTEVVLGGTA